MVEKKFDNLELMRVFNFNFLKKISQLNATIIKLNDIMRKNPYFGLMKINTHDLFH
jgi:hypothetical protein